MIRAIVLFLAVAGFSGGVSYGQEQLIPAPVRPEGYSLVATVKVSGGPDWTDAGLDVLVGQEFWFEASGTICLQTGNPEAYCDPEGLKIQMFQQPLPENNLGCLIGKVRQHVEVIEDPQTKEKTVRDFGKVFFIGKAGLVEIPADGRLFLGPNETVTGDNDGAFVVLIYRKG